MASAFSTDQRGSAGIDIILCLLMFLIFLVLPLMLFLFEVNMHIAYGHLAAGAVDNLLEQTDWHVTTPDLATGLVNAQSEDLEQDLKREFQEKEQFRFEGLRLEKLSVETENNWGYGHAQVRISVTLSYPSVTYIGRFLSGERLLLEINRCRELPVDR